MNTFLQFLFWACTISMVHTYILYPFLLKWWTKGKKLPLPAYYPADEAPKVIVLMAAYNEELVIGDKIESLLGLDYPKDRLQIFIGSDNSTDRTNAIVQSYAERDSRIKLMAYTNRNGKPKIINRLVEEVRSIQRLEDDLLFLMTDASVMLAKDTLKNLARHMRDADIALVDTNMQNIENMGQGIAKSEKHYVSREVLLKHQESILWKRMIGPFGGCYLMRSSYYSPVPPKFLVDDFYIALKVFEQGGGAINDLEAFSYEKTSEEMQEEYRRKKRIGAGNVQNLLSFKHLLFPVTQPLGFAFFSHKVLRWKGPFFIIFAFLTSGILAYNGNQFYLLLFILQIMLWIMIPVIDNLLRKVNIHITILRHIRYFIFMNMALLEGFFKYVKGVKNNVWQPTKRN